MSLVNIKADPSGTRHKSSDRKSDANPKKLAVSTGGSVSLKHRHTRSALPYPFSTPNRNRRLSLVFLIRCARPLLDWKCPLSLVLGSIRQIRFKRGAETMSEAR